MPAATGPANSCNPPVDADAAELAALDERHLLARLRQLDREEPATLAGPYHDRVVVLIGHCVFPPCPWQSLVTFLSSAAGSLPRGAGKFRAGREPGAPATFSALPDATSNSSLTELACAWSTEIVRSMNHHL